MLMMLPSHAICLTPDPEELFEMED